MDHQLDDPELLLRTLRPQPRPEFVSALEASLKRSLESPRPAPRRRRMPRLVVAVGVAGALASGVFVLSISGALPQNVGSAGDAAAERECDTVTEWRLERRPRVVFGRDGNLELLTQPRLVARPAIRCH
jgi:hypothetical protein